MEEFTVQKTEYVCELFEGLDENFVNNFINYGRKFSLPATVASIRLHYFIDEEFDTKKELLIKKFVFTLTKLRKYWDQFCLEEKIAFVKDTGISNIFIFY